MTLIQRRLKKTPMIWRLNNVSTSFAHKVMTSDWIHVCMPVVSDVDTTLLKRQWRSGNVLSTFEFWILSSAYSVDWIRHWYDVGLIRHRHGISKATPNWFYSLWIMKLENLYDFLLCGVRNFGTSEDNSFNPSVSNSQTWAYKGYFLLFCVY